jgi:hypothetical protein
MLSNYDSQVVTVIVILKQTKKVINMKLGTLASNGKVQLLEKRHNSES